MGFVTLIVRCRSCVPGCGGCRKTKILSWFKSNHNIVVLAYALAIIIISINALSTLLYTTNQLAGAPGGLTIQPALNPVLGYSSVYDIFNAVYVITSIMSFLLTWIATVLLLRTYSRKLGRVRYWVLVSIPLVYFLSQFQPVFLDVFTSFWMSEPILFGVVYTLFFDATI